MSNKSEQRETLEAYMKSKKGPFTVVQLALATGSPEESVRRRIQHLVRDMVVVNVKPNVRPSIYQHATHYQKAVEKTKGAVASRKRPIVNSMMPNGSRSYWKQHMARFNETPRAA